MDVEEKLGKKASEICLMTPSTPSMWFGWSVLIITWDQTERERERKRAYKGCLFLSHSGCLNIPQTGGFYNRCGFSQP